MTTIPLKDDGSPDWGRVGPEETYAANLIARAAYIAGLERCARWHDLMSLNFMNLMSPSLADEHRRSFEKINEWIEKEKANG